jgi:C-terminal processing protease CtpA/Prc
VLLDPAAGHMLLGATRESDAPTLRSTSGLLLALAGERLRVLHVMRGSPAAAAGWREGDSICAVDGTRIGPAYARSPLAGWPAGPAGRTVTLDDCTGTRRTLTLRRFY